MSAAHRVQVFVLQTRLGYLRVTASAFPHPRGNPLLVEEQPFDRPGDDPVYYGFIGPPLVFDRIVDAQARKYRWIAEPINVLRGLTRAAWIRADRRINDENAEVWVLQIPIVEEASREVDDANAVDLADRPQRAFPHPHPVRSREKLKLRTLRPQFSILLVD
jgi:hypothetical protein